ncbi:MAG TPA: OmpA family protein [Burkholderiaceae bacterium]|nr:OmpA family protein [Burkholderiaceae bacterium]
MRTTFTRKQTALASSCALALVAFSATVAAQDVNEHALLTDSRGQPVMSGTGLCVHSGFGPAPTWTEACHAARPAPVAQYVAPREAAPVAAAPAIAAAGASAPIYEKVVFDANVLFDSNKSELRPAGRDTLDQFVGKISGLESQSMMAIGYADRMGSEGSNQILSEERVGAVKTYLVSQGVAADRVKTSAWGETRPTTNLSDCKDANNAKNVACMQPDRHVFIEISGTRITQ